MKVLKILTVIQKRSPKMQKKRTKDGNNKMVVTTGKRERVARLRICF